MSDGGCISETPKPEAQRENGIMSERNHKDSVLYQESVDSPECKISTTTYVLYSIAQCVCTCMHEYYIIVKMWASTERSDFNMKVF